MANTKIPLRSWLWAAWLTVTSKGGHSAAELARQIGVHQETAFTMLHKLRHAMVAPSRGMLTGRVEVDETYVGGPEPGKRGRGASGKAIVIGAVEDRGEHAGRLRLRRIDSVSALHIHKFVREVVEPGSTIVTDGNSAYGGLDDYRHVVEVAEGDARSQDGVLRFFHLAVSNLKTWLKGTHHGRVEPKHLQAYLDEFVFRYNRRRDLGGAVRRLLGLSSQAEPWTYDDIYRRAPRRRTPGLLVAKKGRR
jgi:transposase-like protein